MNISDFTIGFWHPFGPHGRETPEQIIDRKRSEIANNGWTLWSFQYRRPQVLETWFRHLRAVDPDSVLDEHAWQSLPAGVRVPHPFRYGRSHASAFVVQHITHPVGPFRRPPVEWLSEGQWLERPLPTRGEYLIRRGGTVCIRGIRAVLELRAPYLALVSAREPEHARCT